MGKGRTKGYAQIILKNGLGTGVARDTRSLQPGHIIGFGDGTKRNTQIELIIARRASRHQIKNVAAASRTTNAVNEPVTSRIGTSGANGQLNVIRLFRVMAVVH